MNRSSEELGSACEAAELAAARSRYAAFPTALREATGMGATPLGGALLLHADFDVLANNMVLGLGVHAPATERDLEEATRLYESRGARRFMVAIPPHARPAALTGWLEARGFYPHNHWLRLASELPPTPPARTDLRIAEFGVERAKECGELTAESFGHPRELAAFYGCVVGLPDWRCFGAFDGDTLVAAGVMHVDGDAAWFGSTSTRATHRGRGAQSALIATRLAAVREAGCVLVSVETAADTPEKPNPSTHNLRRMGFRDLYERVNWVKVLRET